MENIRKTKKQKPIIKKRNSRMVFLVCINILSLVVSGMALYKISTAASLIENLISSKNLENLQRQLEILEKNHTEKINNLSQTINNKYDFFKHELQVQLELSEDKNVEKLSNVINQKFEILRTELKSLSSKIDFNAFIDKETSEENPLKVNCDTVVKVDVAKLFVSRYYANMLKNEKVIEIIHNFVRELCIKYPEKKNIYTSFNINVNPLFLESSHECINLKKIIDSYFLIS